MGVLLYFCAFLLTVLIWLILSYLWNSLKYNQIPNVTYSITGNPKGKIICFIHGWPDLPETWKKQIDHLKSDYLCIVFCLPNFDMNHECQNPWGYSAVACADGIKNQILFILNTKYPQKQNDGVILMIHDWGSRIGQLIIHKYPELISKAIVIDIGNSAPIRNKVMVRKILTYQLFNVFCFLLPRFVGDRLMNAALRRANKEKGGMELPMVKHQEKIGKTLLHSGMNYLYFYFYLHLVLCKNIRVGVPKCPVFYGFGKWKIGPWYTKKWKKQLSERGDCVFKEYDAKHWVMIDQCDLFNHDVCEWLDKNQ